MKKNTFIGVLLVLALCLMVFPVLGFAQNDGVVAYRSPVYTTDVGPLSGIAKWETLSCETYTKVTADMTTWNEGWYVVEGTVDIDHTITCNGEVHLILTDGCKLNINGNRFKPGICVSGDNNRLIIYGQIDGTGELKARGGYMGAGIGSDSYQSAQNITINGGKIDAQGNEGGAGIGGGDDELGKDIVINGGTITAIGGDQDGDYGGGAGIGGGNNGLGENIIINGGTISATGGADAAGIGGGNNKGVQNITINGGEIIATSSKHGAGIGGGDEGDAYHITINGGTITAESKEMGAGIGGGNDGIGVDITINGGSVTATGAPNSGWGAASGIGEGPYLNIHSEDIYAAGAVVVKAGSSVNPTTIIAHNRHTDLAKIPNFLSSQYVTTEESAHTTYEVTNVGALNSALQQVNHGDIIKLGSNINLSDTFDLTSEKEFILDLNGYTLLLDDNKALNISGDITVKNGKVKNDIHVLKGEVLLEDLSAEHLIASGENSVVTLKQTINGTTGFENIAFEDGAVVMKSTGNSIQTQNKFYWRTVEGYKNGYDYDILTELTADDFVFTAPEDFTYRSEYPDERKEAKVTVNDASPAKDLIGDITLVYYKDGGDDPTDPIKIGDYSVAINVTPKAGCEEYFSGYEGLTDESWKFAITLRQNIYQGNGLPTDDLGVIGDYYKDLKTGNLYRKNGTGWVFAGNIKDYDFDNTGDVKILDNHVECFYSSKISQEDIKLIENRIKDFKFNNLCPAVREQAVKNILIVLFKEHGFTPEDIQLFLKNPDNIIEVSADVKILVNEAAITGASTPYLEFSLNATANAHIISKSLNIDKKISYQVKKDDFANNARIDMEIPTCGNYQVDHIIHKSDDGNEIYEVFKENGQHTFTYNKETKVISLTVNHFSSFRINGKSNVDTGIMNNDQSMLCFAIGALMLAGVLCFMLVNRTSKES